MLESNELINLQMNLSISTQYVSNGILFSTRTNLSHSCLGALQRKKFPKSEITREVGGWVQVPIGFFCWKIVPK